MRVELSRIHGATNVKMKNQVIDEILEQAENDTIYLSDLIVEHEISEPLLASLRTDHTKKYKLYMVIGEWGEKPEPGFVVKRKFKKPLIDREGHLYPAKTLNSWKRKGIYEKKRYRFEEHKLDEKGCITVSAADAEYFLMQFGIHSESGYPLSYHPDEKSQEQVKCPHGGYRHVWYWRFKEMDEKMYAELPVLKRSENQPNGKNTK